MKLLVIDIQKGITDNRLYNFESFIDNTKRINCCKCGIHFYQSQI